MKLLNKLTEAGLNFTNQPFERRGVLLANQVSLIIFTLNLFLFILYYWWFGWNDTAKTFPINFLICALVISLNKLGLTNIGRLLISLYLPIILMVVSIYSKSLYFQTQEPLNYFSYRFLILSACVIPVVIFSVREKWLLISSILINLGMLMAYDPLHSAFGVDYHIIKIGVGQPLIQIIGNYHFINIVSFITYWILIGTVLFLKNNAEKNEEDNYQLIQELNDQKHEIQAQADELQQANNIIAKQNIILESNLAERNKELTETNEELIKNNNELQQFSYAVSHNLRGPVASLIGLISLLKKDELDEGIKEVVNHIQSSSMKLDGIVSGLNAIADIRHSIFQIRQKVDLKQELIELKEVFQKELEEFDFQLNHNFAECPEIYAIKPMVHSILYNLISNSIKYHSSDRRPEIEIKSEVLSGYFVLTVEDNGLGIDLERDKDNLFKIFKRFHEHSEGKGLGLYLIKTQAEAMGGRVEVESKVNQFTRFKVYIKVPPMVQEQILLDDHSAKIFFDATINATGVVWKRSVSHEEYKKVYGKCLEFLRIYNTPSWIADHKYKGLDKPDDIEWLIQYVVPEASKNGLKCGAIVLQDTADPHVREQVETLIKKLAHFNIQGQLFYNYEQARNWIALCK